MNNQKEKIRQLYIDGILSKEEMETELQKISNTKPTKPFRTWIWVLSGIVLVGLIAIIGFNVNPKPSSDTNFSENHIEILKEVAEVTDEGSSLGGESPQWKVTDINGSPAIQTQFFNSENGILQMAYSPNIGFRFALLDDGMNPLPIDDKIIGYMEKGEEFPMMIPMPKRDDNKLYYDIPKFVEKLNSGSIEYLTIERTDERGALDESYSHRWHISLKEGEFSKMIQGLSSL